MPRYSLCLLLACGLTLGCGSSESPAEWQIGRDTERTERLNSPPEITSEGDPQMHDLVFRCEAVKSPKNLGGWSFDAKGMYHGQPVGFTFSLGSTWAMAGDPDFRINWGTAVFTSTGETSDRFLQALADEYHIAKPPKKMAAKTYVDVAVLEGDPERPNRGVLKIKVFFGNDEPSPTYGELFVNVDMATSRLSLLEKDAEYEAGIVRNLGGGGATHSEPTNR